MTVHATRIESEAGARLRAAAIQALRDELMLYPKPGLVSPVDSGSHSDMDAATFLASIDALEDYFGAIADLGLAGAEFETLQRLGQRAERQMMQATGGINCHRGAIFSLGLICAAAGRLSGLRRDAESICAEVRLQWGEAILEAGRKAALSPPEALSHGAAVRRTHGLRGAREEASDGFPIIVTKALPLLRQGRTHGDRRAATLDAFFAIAAVLPDNNMVHRGGREALEEWQSRSRAFLAAGGAMADGAEEEMIDLHRWCVSRRLSPGGAADLLACSLFLHAWEGSAEGPFA